MELLIPNLYAMTISKETDFAAAQALQEMIHKITEHQVIAVEPELGEMTDSDLRKGLDAMAGAVGASPFVNFYFPPSVSEKEIRAAFYRRGSNRNDPVTLERLPQGGLLLYRAGSLPQGPGQKTEPALTLRPFFVRSLKQAQLNSSEDGRGMRISAARLKEMVAATLLLLSGSNPEIFSQDPSNSNWISLKSGSNMGRLAEFGRLLASMRATGKSA